MAMSTYWQHFNAFKPLCSSTDPNEHLALKMDVTDRTSVESAIGSAIEKLNTPPSLIANSAGIVKDGFILQMEEKRFMDVLDVNLKVKF